MLNLPGLDLIRQRYPDLYPIIDALHRGISNVASQTNANPNGSQQKPPTPIAGLNVTEKGGIHDVQITDNAPAARGVSYFTYYSQTPDMSNAHKIDLGASQNHRANLGPGKYYWSAHSSYDTGDASAMVFHGGATPAAVGSGTYAGPAMQQAQGGTAFGPQFKNATKAPARG